MTESSAGMVPSAPPDDRFADHDAGLLSSRPTASPREARTSSAPAPEAPPAPLAPSPPSPSVRVEMSPQRAAAMAQWETIVGALTETRPALGAVLQHAVPVEISGARILIAFPRGSFYARQAESDEAKSALADIAERVLSARPNVDVLVRDEVEPSHATSTLARIEEERLRARHEATRKKALNHPIVVEALQLFDAGKSPVEVRIDGD